MADEALEHDVPLAHGVHLGQLELFGIVDDPNLATRVLFFPDRNEIVPGPIFVLLDQRIWSLLTDIGFAAPRLLAAALEADGDSGWSRRVETASSSSAAASFAAVIAAVSWASCPSMPDTPPCSPCTAAGRAASSWWVRPMMSAATSVWLA